MGKPAARLSTNAEYNINKTVSYFNTNAKSKSTGKCARMVRQAINAGGINMTKHPISAKDYGSYLTKYGFTQTTATFSNAQIGDISVIQPYAGQSHSHGHISMYNGSIWISDFKQRDMWSGPGYRKNKPSYTIYRWAE